MFAVVTGTRPEIIKMFPITKELDIHKIDYKYIYTGQHFDNSLSFRFFEELLLPMPDYKINLQASKNQSNNQIPEMVSAIRKVFMKENFTGVIVQGDTNSVLAASIVSAQQRIPLYHVEAGLRCFDYRMQEERNRIIVDHLSSILFTPTENSRKNLERENIGGKIYTVGNTVMDAIKFILNNPNGIATTSFDASNEDYVAVTLHRYENLKNKNFLSDFLLGLQESNLNYILPIHPHTLKQIRKFDLEHLLTKRVKTVPPMGYFNFLSLLRKSKFVITDSGGIQEEITSPLINKYALVVRPNTERPESVASGHSRLLTAFSKDNLLNEIQRIEDGLLKDININQSPYGNGDSAQRIVEVIIDQYQTVAKFVS